MAFTAPLAPRAAGDWAAQDGPPQGFRGILRAFHQYHSTCDMLPANPPARYNPRSCSSQGSTFGRHCDEDAGSVWDTQWVPLSQLQQPDVCSSHTRHWADIAALPGAAQKLQHVQHVLAPHVRQGACQTNTAATTRGHGTLRCRSTGFKGSAPPAEHHCASARGQTK